MNDHHPRVLVILLALILTLPACGGRLSEVSINPAIAQYRITRLAVLPFSLGSRTIGEERGYAAPAPPPEAAETLTDLFYVKLQDRTGLTVIAPEQARDVLAALSERPLALPALRTLGEQLHVDAVLTGIVEVYKEREGSVIGLARPQDAAELGFTVRLISTTDGVTLWNGQYHERQRPAIEDLRGFWARGPRYLTVEQLAEFAVEQVLEEFPRELRQAADHPAPAEGGS